jgi:hypothetical protein
LLGASSPDEHRDAVKEPLRRDVPGVALLATPQKHDRPNLTGDPSHLAPELDLASCPLHLLDGVAQVAIRARRLPRRTTPLGLPDDDASGPDQKVIYLVAQQIVIDQVPPGVTQGASS